MKKLAAFLLVIAAGVGACHTDELDDMKTILAELRVTNRIVVVLLIAILVKSFF